MGGSGNLPVGPGIFGFIAVFLLAVALWFLMRNMNARMRRMAYRERDRLEQERLEQERRDQGKQGVSRPDGGDDRLRPGGRPEDGSSTDGPAPRA